MLKRTTFLFLCAFFSFSSLQSVHANSQSNVTYRGRISPPATVFLNLLPLPGMGIGSFVQGDVRTGMLLMGSTTVGFTLLMMGISQQFFSVLDTQPGSDGTRPFPLTPSVLPLMIAGSVFLTFSLVWSIVAPLKHGWRKVHQFKDPDVQRDRKQTPSGKLTLLEPSFLLL